MYEKHRPYPARVKWLFPEPAGVDNQAQPLQDLKSPEAAAAYLEAALEDEDSSVFLLALRHVTQGQSQSLSLQ